MSALNCALGANPDGSSPALFRPPTSDWSAREGLATGKPATTPKRGTHLTVKPRRIPQISRLGGNLSLGRFTYDYALLFGLLAIIVRRCLR